MRSWCNENFESDEGKVMFGTFAAFVGFHQTMLEVEK
jgi:hypothetical protein